MNWYTFHEGLKGKFGPYRYWRNKETGNIAEFRESFKEEPPVTSTGEYLLFGTDVTTNGKEFSWVGLTIAFRKPFIWEDKYELMPEDWKPEQNLLEKYFEKLGEVSNAQL